MSEHFTLGWRKVNLLNADGCLLIRPVGRNKKAEALPGYTPHYFKCDKGGKNPVTDSAPSERVTPSFAQYNGDLIDQFARIVDDRIERYIDYYDNLASAIVKQREYELDTLMQKLNYEYDTLMQSIDDFDPYNIEIYRYLNQEKRLKLLRESREFDFEMQKLNFAREKWEVERQDKQRFRMELALTFKKLTETLKLICEATANDRR